MLILLASLALADAPPDAVVSTTSVPRLVASPAHQFDAVAVPEPFRQMGALRASLADHAQDVGDCIVGFDGAFLKGTLKIGLGASAGVGDVSRSDNVAVDVETLDCLNDAFRDATFPYTPEVTPVNFLFR